MLKKLYKDLHQIPELAFKEIKTKQYIMNILDQNQIQYKNYSNGLIAKIEINPKWDYVAFRTELDGLKIKENTNVNFKSNFNMHACGHDMHMSIVLGICLNVNQKKECLSNNVLFIFQSAEEDGQGSQQLIKEVKWPKIQKIYAFHNSNVIDINSVGLQNGQINSHIIDFEIEFKGKSAHVAQPYLGVDALNSAINFINLIKQNQSVNFGAHKQYLINFSNINTNNAQNVICDKCIINGTIRIGSLDLIENIKKFFKTTLNTVSTLNNCYVKYSLKELRALINDSSIHNEILELNLNYKLLNVMSSGGDDFSNYSYLAPIYLIKIGSKWNDNEYINYPVHSTKFLPNYNGIEYGVICGLKLLNLSNCDIII